MKPTTTVTVDDETMFTRLGGTNVVRQAVSEFHDRLLADKELVPLFEGVPLAHLKTHQFKFMKVALTTSDPKAVEKNLRLFLGKNLNEDHFDLVLEHFIGTLVNQNVPVEVIDASVAVLASLRTICEDSDDEEDDCKSRVTIESSENSSIDDLTDMIRMKPAKNSKSRFSKFVNRTMGNKRQ